MPSFTNTSGSVGLPNGNSNNSGNLNHYLWIDGLNGNSLTNILGFEGKYFLSDCWDINMQFSMDINLTPSKDYVEGEDMVEDMIIPAQKYINAQMTNNWFVSVGSNRYFKVNIPRIHPYLGASVGFQMPRIETIEPYIGDYVYDEDIEEGLPSQLYLAGSRAGQAFGVKGAAVAGIEYSIAPGLVLGFQCQPLTYRYNVIQICPKGFDKYNASHHNKINELRAQIDNHKCPEPQPCPEITVTKPGMKSHVVFGLAKTNITPDQDMNIQAIADYLKQYPEAKATVTGYADKGTGNAKINQQLAEKRANIVADS